jgi:hypothetical protein
MRRYTGGHLTGRFQAGCGTREDYGYLNTLHHGPLGPSSSTLMPSATYLLYYGSFPLVVFNFALAISWEIGRHVE